MFYLANGLEFYRMREYAIHVVLNNNNSPTSPFTPLCNHVYILIFVYTCFSYSSLTTNLKYTVKYTSTECPTVPEHPGTVPKFFTLYFPVQALNCKLTIEE